MNLKIYYPGVLYFEKYTTGRGGPMYSTYGFKSTAKSPTDFLMDSGAFSNFAMDSLMDFRGR